MATLESQGYVAHYKINNPPHFFIHDDIGNEFVRTAPYHGYDWSFTVKGNNASDVKAAGLKLVEIHPNYLKFQERTPLNRICGWEYVKLEKTTDENWDDGNWISVEKCIQLFSAAKPQPRYYMADEWD